MSATVLGTDEVTIDMIGEEASRKKAGPTVPGEPEPETNEGEEYYKLADERFEETAPEKYLVLTSSSVKGSIPAGTVVAIQIDYFNVFVDENGTRKVIYRGEFTKNISFGNWIQWNDPLNAIEELKRRLNNLSQVPPEPAATDDTIQTAIALQVEIQRLNARRIVQGPFEH